jgi:hypothetical protein
VPLACQCSFRMQLAGRSSFRLDSAYSSQAVSSKNPVSTLGERVSSEGDSLSHRIPDEEFRMSNKEFRMAKSLDPCARAHAAIPLYKPSAC